jgi:hypothetical protein
LKKTLFSIVFLVPDPDFEKGLALFNIHTSSYQRLISDEVSIREIQNRDVSV